MAIKTKINNDYLFTTTINYSRIIKSKVNNQKGKSTMSTRAELLLELKMWSNTAQNNFAGTCRELLEANDAVHGDLQIRKLTIYRNTKLVVDKVIQLLERCESYGATVKICRDKAIAAFREGETARGEVWLDWSNNFTLNAPEEF